MAGYAQGMLPAGPENVADDGREGDADREGALRREAAVRVDAHSERETPGGWGFTLRVQREDAPEGEHDVTLSWADYEYWSHGLASPSRVVEAAVRGLLVLSPDAKLPGRFDASTCRRWAGGKRLDEWLREHL